MKTIARQLAERDGKAEPPAVCDYCREQKPEGYTPQYKAWMCEECYEDHHGEV